MAKKQPDKQPAVTLKQVNVRFDPVYFTEIEEVAGLLGLDVAQLLRMIVRENFAEYRRRADRVREGSPERPGED